MLEIYLRIEFLKIEVRRMVDKKEAKQKIADLVEKYKKVKDAGKINKYSEADTKTKFIEPFFEALGWDFRSVDDEVSKEESISKGRVDYGFRINGIPKLFVEAKKLKANLEDTKFAKQATNYAWHKATTWAVLTDFEGLKIFNAEVKNVRESLFINLRWDEYLDNLDKLWLLSKESIVEGKLDEAAETFGKKAKKTPIDKQLLNDFTTWRELLSKDYLKNNQDKHFTGEDLDEVVQRMLNRLIFIRKAEDSGLEESKLKEALRVEKEGNNWLYKEVQGIFRYFDDKYDSNLFAYHECDQAAISNDVLEQVLKGLYKTKDNTISYDFSAIDADILGNIYEQYLGHLLRKTPKRAKLKEKHSKRKKHGIYYTPTYIVDYIVKNTLGELLKGKKTNPEEIKVLDPACGSGSFLLKAFDYLDKNYKEKGKGKQAELDSAGIVSRRTKILKNNIYGVDLDPRAVEIAQLNLLLKAAEQRHRLPELNEKIKEGNSLIDDSEVAGDKAFKWDEEFEDVMDEGGFDVVIGNPPYVRTHELEENHKDYFEEKYESAVGQYDLYVLFYEKGINLLKEGGKLGFITSNKFIISKYGEKLRKLILDTCVIEKVIDVSNVQVFKDASTYPYIFILRKENDKNKRDENKIEFLKITEEGKLQTKDYDHLVNQKKLLELDDNLFIFSIDEASEKIIDKVEKGGKVIDLYRAKPTTSNILSNENKKKIAVLRNKDIQRYGYDFKEKYVKKKKEWQIEKPCLFLKKICSELTATYIKKENMGAVNTIYVAHSKTDNISLKYILGILNSSLINFYTKKLYFSTHMRGGYIELRTFEIKNIPIIEAPEEKQKPIIDLADKMLELNKKLQKMGDKQTDKRKKLEKKIEKTDKKIDELVYDLYGITKKEKEVIEEGL